MAALTDGQLQDLRDRLDRREAELVAEVRSKGPEAGVAPGDEPQHQVEDLGEQGEQRIREAVAQAEQERDVDELRQIAAAKERLSRGEYGMCVDCGADIPYPRLQAQPAAARCVADQERYERTHTNVVRIPPLA
jgi:RNA polymerase-binding transcription factor DksA